MKYICLKDFGLDVLMSRVEESNFPWLISNVFDAENKEPLGNVYDRTIIDINGLRVSFNNVIIYLLSVIKIKLQIKIGIMGLVEEEWITTLSVIDSDDIDYEDFVLAGKRIALELKNENVFFFHYLRIIHRFS